MNRKQRRHSGKPQGVNLAAQMAHTRRLAKAAQQAANDKMVQLKSEIHTQRVLWLACVAMNDAFGIGPERFQKFADALTERTKWYEEMEAGADAEYANEKLRQAAERCSGIKIEYLYEHELREAQRMLEEVQCDGN